jgi:hypothetical protein
VWLLDGQILAVEFDVTDFVTLRAMIHAGIGQDDGTVVSKWGEYALLRHPGRVSWHKGSLQAGGRRWRCATLDW